MKIGMVDTTFARIDMGAIAVDELKKHLDVEIERRTVPGIKDLAAECKKMLDAGCDVCLALGMVGGAPIDTQCAHEASLGIQQAKLLTGKHIIEVFVHENEAWSQREFSEICEDRIRKHAHNAVFIVKNPEELMKLAGMGVRQGKEDEGRIGKDKRIQMALVVSQFNNEITERMLEKAQEVMNEEEVDAEVVRVPGVYDMPLVVKKILMDKKIDGVVTLGAVIKGETAHDEVIAKDTARRLGDLSLEFRKPVTLGIIGPDADWEDAEERAEEYAERAVKSVVYLIKLLRG